MDIKKVIKSLEILAIPLNVKFDEEDVNRNFRTLANLYHPDKQKINDNGKKFKELKEAQEFILLNIQNIKKLNLKNIANDLNFHNNENELQELARRERERQEQERREREMKEKIINDKLRRKKERIEIKKNIFKKVKSTLKYSIPILIIFIMIISILLYLNSIRRTVSIYSYKNVLETSLKTCKGKYIESPEISHENGFYIEWYDNESFEGTPISFPYNIVEDLSLYPKLLTFEYSITFDSNEGTHVETIYRNYLDYIIEPSIPNKNGYTFCGWFTEMEFINLYVFDTMPNHNIKLYAKWKINNYTLSFESNGGSKVDPINGEFESQIIAPIQPIREGYTFNGWYSDKSLENKYLLNTVPAEDIVLYAKWIINEYTLTFDTNGGEKIDSLTYEYNSFLVLPKNPIKEGYTFKGWYVDPEYKDNFIWYLVLVNDVTLYAKWIKNYKFSFVSNGGSYIEPLEKDAYTYITFSVPEKEGYDFDGWYIDSELTNKFTFSSMPADNYILYAKWRVK